MIGYKKSKNEKFLMLRVNNRRMRSNFRKEIMESRYNMNAPFYLKVNRDVDYAYYCLRFWLEVAIASNAPTYIVCDNEAFEQKIKKKIEISNDGSVTFIKSLTEQVEDISLDIATNSWKKASDAHLTTFFHAKACGYSAFWNIDADDTSFGMSTLDTVKTLSAVENYAKENSIGVFSLDMWWTIHGGNNWTFGITYTDMTTIDWFSIIDAHRKDQEYIQLPESDGNVDSFFNYLRNVTQLSIESFYIKNSFFVHWGGPFGPLSYEFLENEVKFPKSIVSAFATTMKVGTQRVLREVIPIDVGYAKEHYKEYSKKKYCKKISKEYGRSAFFYIVERKGISGLIKIFVNHLKKHRKAK